MSEVLRDFPEVCWDPLTEMRVVGTEMEKGRAASGIYGKCSWYANREFENQR